jgi:hypothetical protein
MLRNVREDMQQAVYTLDAINVIFLLGNQQKSGQNQNSSKGFSDSELFEPHHGVFHQKFDLVYRQDFGPPLLVHQKLSFHYPSHGPLLLNVAFPAVLVPSWHPPLLHAIR